MTPASEIVAAVQAWHDQVGESELDELDWLEEWEALGRILRGDLS